MPVYLTLHDIIKRTHCYLAEILLVSVQELEMDTQTPEEARNHFYPNCGCDSPDECVTCPHCGMCVTKAEVCACCSLPLEVDTALDYDPHQETLGG